MFLYVELLFNQRYTTVFFTSSKWYNVLMLTVLEGLILYTE